MIKLVHAVPLFPPVPSFALAAPPSPFLHPLLSSSFSAVILWLRQFCSLQGDGSSARIDKRNVAALESTSAVPTTVCSSASRLHTTPLSKGSQTDVFTTGHRSPEAQASFIINFSEFLTFASANGRRLWPSTNQRRRGLVTT